MKINKKDLQQALEIVKPGLATQEKMEQTTSFAFLGDRVVTYNDRISISHPVENLELEGAIRAEEFYNLLNKIEGEELLVSLTENELKVKAGNVKAGIRLDTEITLPLGEINSKKQWEDLPEAFASDLNFIKDSASSDMSQRIMTCIHVEENFMESSDNFQIMRAYWDPEQPFPFPDMLIPAEKVPEINKINPYQVAVSDGWIHFRNMEGTELSCRILEDSYMETGDHFQVDGNELTFPKSMDKILDRVMVFTQKDHLMDEEMQVKIKNNTLMVKGSNDYGWIKEKAKVKYDGKEASFWITPALLQNILRRSNTCLLSEEKIKFEGDGWEYVAVLRG